MGLYPIQAKKLLEKTKRKVDELIEK